MFCLDSNLRPRLAWLALLLVMALPWARTAPPSALQFEDGVEVSSGQDLALVSQTHHPHTAQVPLVRRLAAEAGVLLANWRPELISAPLSEVLSAPAPAVDVQVNELRRGPPRG